MLFSESAVCLNASAHSPIYQTHELLTIIVCGIFVFTYKTAPALINKSTRDEFSLAGPSLRPAT